MASSTNQSCDRGARGDFSKGHPCPLEKRRTSCAAPSGSGTAAGCEVHLEGAGPNQGATSLDPRLRGDDGDSGDGEVRPSFPRRREPSVVVLSFAYRRPCNESPGRCPLRRGVRSSGTWMSRVPRKDRMSSAGRSTPRRCGQRRAGARGTSRWVPAFAGMTSVSAWVPAFAGMTGHANKKAREVPGLLPCRRGPGVKRYITRSRPACRLRGPSAGPACTRTQQRRPAGSTEHRPHGTSPGHARRCSRAASARPA